MTYAHQAVPSENGSQKVDVTTTSAQSSTLQSADAVVVVSALCFVTRAGTAVANTSMALAPNVPYRLRGIQAGEKLAFVTASGTATAYITQGV